MGELKKFYKSQTFIHFSRPLTLSKEEALVVESGHPPAAHVDIERIRVSNSEKQQGEEVGGVVLFEKHEENGVLSMLVEQGNGKPAKVLPLRNGEWLTVPAFEFHNAFTLCGEQELEIVEPARTGSISILATGKAKLDRKLLEESEL